MPKILPPYQIITPDYEPGYVAIVKEKEGKHANWLEDYEYYDQLGRDPLQVRKIWGIDNAQRQADELNKLLDDYPKQMHRRMMLFKAACRGDENIVRCLIRAGVVIQPDIQKKLAEEQAMDSDAQDRPETGNTTDLSKLSSVFGRKEGETRQATSPQSNASEDYDLPDKFDESCVPVHAAISHGQLGVLQIFLQSGVDVDVKDEFGRTLLIAAAAQPEILKYLLAHGADPLARSFDNDFAKEWLGKFAGCNVLECAAPHGNVEILKLLLDIPGIQVTSRAVRDSASAGYEALKLMLDRGGYVLGEETRADMLTSEQRKTIAEATPLAVEYGDLESMKLLMRLQSSVDEKGVSSFDIPPSIYKTFIYGAYNGIAQNKPDKFRFIFDLGLKQHETMSLDKLREGQRFNIQHLFDKAAETGAIDSARYLISEHGANPDTFRLPPGIQPLYMAALHNKPDMIQFLIEECNADIHKGNGRWSAGPTAMWGAIHMKSLECISILLQHGGPVDHVDEDILNIDGPINAILTTITSRGLRVLLKTEENASTEIEQMRNRFSRPNPSYVRVALTAEDRSWIAKLVPRKPDESFREHGELARILNEEEAFFTEDFDWDDPRHRLPDYPIDEDREQALRQDDDLIPLFKPAFVRSY